MRERAIRPTAPSREELSTAISDPSAMLESMISTVSPSSARGNVDMFFPVSESDPTLHHVRKGVWVVSDKIKFATQGDQHGVRSTKFSTTRPPVVENLLGVDAFVVGALPESKRSACTAGIQNLRRKLLRTAGRPAVLCTTRAD